jgi:DNA-binding IclR family transcriptional regulator
VATETAVSDHGAPNHGAPDDPRPISAQTLDRGLRLLELVAQAQHGLNVTEAARMLGIGRTVVYRLAGTLLAHGLIRRDRTGRLRLGTGVLALARHAQPLLAEAASASLRRLAEEVGATAHLTVAEGTEAVAYVVVEPSWTQFHVGYRVGSRHSLDCGAAGRAILVGRRGETAAVTSEGELEPGAYGIAAPVLGSAGLEASVGVVALTALDLAVVGPQVVAAAAAVARALG